MFTTKTIHRTDENFDEMVEAGLKAHRGKLMRAEKERGPKERKFIKIRREDDGSWHSIHGRLDSITVAMFDNTPTLFLGSFDYNWRKRT